MAAYSIIQKSQLEGALRLDAEYYQPEYLEVKNLLFSKPHFILGDHAFITDGEHGSVDFVDDGVKYLVADNIQEGFLNLNGIRYVSEKVDKRNKRASLKPLDITLSIKGTVGLAAVVFEEDLPANMNRDVSRIHVKDKIDPFLLAAFLNSKYGRGQTLRESSGNVQQMITLGRIRELIIPSLHKKLIEEIKRLYSKSYDELKKSSFFYSQAENLLLEELGLKDFKFEDDLSFVVNLSDVKFAGRADAEYFQPKYEKIFDYIKRPIKKLGEITKFLNHAKQPPYVEDGEIPIITQKHLGKTCINLDLINDPETKFTNSNWIEHNPSFKLQKGDILYYSVGAYIGKTNVVLEDINAVSASFITIMRLKEEIDPIYLVVVLNSIVGKLQSDKWQSATAQQYIYPKDIKNFKIPILPKPTQQKIADLVQKSHEARKKAKELLEEAKRKVETSIETQSKGTRRTCQG